MAKDAVVKTQSFCNGSGGLQDGFKAPKHHLDSPLVMQQTLQEQGIVGKAAWCFIRGLPVPGGELALEGVTRIAGVTGAPRNLEHLPKGLESLIYGSNLNRRLEGVALPSCLKSFTFGDDFNQSLERLAFARSLQSLTFASTRAWKE
jgi:hypothetical protein